MVYVGNINLLRGIIHHGGFWDRRINTGSSA
jgi:hypothetical protein